MELMLVSCVDYANSDSQSILNDMSRCHSSNCQCSQSPSESYSVVRSIVAMLCLVAVLFVAVPCALCAPAHAAATVSQCDDCCSSAKAASALPCCSSHPVTALTAVNLVRAGRTMAIVWIEQPAGAFIARRNVAASRIAPPPLLQTI